MAEVSKALRQKVKEKLTKRAFVDQLPDDIQPLAHGAVAGGLLGLAQPIYSRGLHALGDIPYKGPSVPRRMLSNLKYAIPLGIGAGVAYDTFAGGMPASPELSPTPRL
jgi:hypothetical protein